MKVASFLKQLTRFYSLIHLYLIISSNSLLAADPADFHTIEGYWDMTVMQDGKPSPSWLEVMHSGNSRLFGYFVGFGGSARPVSKITFTNGKLSFSLPPQWEVEDQDIVVEATLQGDSLVGTLLHSNGKKYPWVGHKAPALRPNKNIRWGEPIQLLNGNTLAGWHASGSTNQWQLKDGVLINPKSGSNLISDQVFKDFKLHVEFRYPEGSNSGIYLRGRYELQVIDCYGKEPAKDLLGAIYGFIKPTENVAKQPGVWQSYDITLNGRYVTIVANGVTVICNQEIPGITGGALDSHEGMPGPLMLQGDHGPVEFRNIIITPAAN